MTVKDFWTVSPGELEPGDVLVATVTLHVMNHKNEDGKPYFRTYRCRHEGHGIPQGMSMNKENSEALAGAIFPVAKWSELEAE